MKKSILFITPPYHCGVVEVAGRWMPLQFAFLGAAARRAGFQAEIYDAMSKNHDLRHIAQVIGRKAPHLVATSAITATLPDALEVLRLAKQINPSTVTLLGGVHPSFCYEEVLGESPEMVDFVIRGEGEETLREFLLCIGRGKEPTGVHGIAFREDGSIIATRERPFMDDLDELEPAWDLLDWPDYTYYVLPGSRLAVISTSRGCSHDCTFCSQQKFWKQSWRPRRPERVVREVVALHRGYGANVFLIADEHPTNDRERWEELLDRLIRKRLDAYFLMETRVSDIIRDRKILGKYRRAGVIHIYVGVEATDQETLDLVKKDVKTEECREAIALIKSAGMITETSFVLGFPHETQETISRTLGLARLYDPDFAHFLAITPWPYADLFDEVKGRIATRDYRKYNLIDPVIQPYAMSLRQIDQAIVDCYRQFYMGKIREFLSIGDSFRRSYLLRSMQLIMKSSFLIKKVGTLGGIPLKVRRELRNIGRIALYGANNKSRSSSMGALAERGLS